MIFTPLISPTQRMSPPRILSPPPLLPRGWLSHNEKPNKSQKRWEGVVKLTLQRLTGASKLTGLYPTRTVSRASLPAVEQLGLLAGE